VPGTVFLDKNLSINLVPGTFLPGTFLPKQRKGLKRYPFLPQAKKIQAESPVRGPEARGCAQIPE
jgi:hypothetical protein